MSKEDFYSYDHITVSVKEKRVDGSCVTNRNIQKRRAHIKKAYIRNNAEFVRNISPRYTKKVIAYYASWPPSYRTLIMMNTQFNKGKGLEKDFQLT